MKQLKLYMITGVLFVLITGSLAHFVYHWSGNNSIVGLFTPVSESVWEHMKLLFFPMLLYSLIMISRFKKSYPCIAASLCFGTLAGTILIPVLFYAYTLLLGKNLFILDIGTFILSILIAFLLSYRLTLSCRSDSYRTLLYCLTAVLFICFIWFTYHPPDVSIFEAPC